MTVGTRSAVAAARYPHGSPVRLDGDRAHLELDLARIDGVTKRPHVTAATHHEEGEQLLVQVDGGIMAECGGVARWLELQRGRPVNV
ncbi:MAG TPA: hypothetical protein VGD10_08260 [Allosphingosinicella sp.]|uniref:hypothetical protein n=1 Tax=Allosphingosinicella sp. TaxID=2823234 RepID=UPI002EDB276B